MAMDGPQPQPRPGVYPPGSSLDGAVTTPTINQLLDRLAMQPFRARFRLSATDQTLARDRGPATIAAHASDLIEKRLAPAAPVKDGRQTPYRGHPVFVAQHATATCCRSCLRTWHRIEKGRALSAAEQRYVVEVIMSWLRRQLTDVTPPLDDTPADERAGVQRDQWTPTSQRPV